ncbi:MAG: class I SAM-dependent methyltransferase [Alphaproteobacteria bacterium]|nr:class I SAM-dependent methyltransferase [Alphaproteobacteria bacterium]
MSERRPIPLSERLYRRFALKYHGRYLITGLQARARERSLDYIEKYMSEATIFADRWDLLSFALGAAAKDGLALEFGVGDGGSLRHLSVASGRQFHGFDSFEGLPEAWSGTFERAGKFSRKGMLPPVPTNVVLHKGWFDATLPEFLRAHPEPVAFLHVDCDIYSSTRTVLEQLAPRLGAGAVIVFDEYFNYPNWERHEFKAFQEFIRDTGFAYRYLGFAQKNGHVAVKLSEKSEAAKALAAAKLKAAGGD